MKTYHVNLKISLVMEAVDSINPYDILNEMNYGFTSVIEGAVIRETEITDTVIRTKKEK